MKLEITTSSKHINLEVTGAEEKVFLVLIDSTGCKIECATEDAATRFTRALNFMKRSAALDGGPPLSFNVIQSASQARHLMITGDLETPINVLRNMGYVDEVTMEVMLSTFFASQSQTSTLERAVHTCTQVLAPLKEKDRQSVFSKVYKKITGENLEPALSKSGSPSFFSSP